MCYKICAHLFLYWDLFNHLIFNFCLIPMHFVRYMSFFKNYQNNKAAINLTQQWHHMLFPCLRSKSSPPPSPHERGSITLHPVTASKNIHPPPVPGGSVYEEMACKCTHTGQHPHTTVSGCPYRSWVKAVRASFRAGSLAGFFLAVLHSDYPGFFSADLGKLILA